jgi:hypothetical protein
MQKLAVHFRLPRPRLLAALTAGTVLVLTLSPASAALADEPTYPTHNGPKTESALQAELSTAGYQGPWDLPSELNAYDHATAPQLSPPPQQTAQPVAPTSPYADWGQRGPSCAALPYVVGPGYAKYMRQLQGLKPGQFPPPVPSDAYTFSMPSPCVDRTGYPSGVDGSIPCAQLPFMTPFTLGSGPHDHCTGRVNP